MQTPDGPASAQSTNRHAWVFNAHRKRNRRGVTPVVGIVGGLLLALLLAYAVVWGYRFALSQLGPFAPLVAGLALALFVAIAGPWLVVRYRRPLSRVLVASGTRLWNALQTTGVPHRLALRFPRSTAFLRSRLARTATGLGLTVGLLVAGAAVWNVGELLLEVVTGSPVVSTDRRVLNLVATLRTPQLDQAMYAVTYLGNGETLILLAAAAVLIAFAAGRWRDATLLVLALVASELFFQVLKLLVQRPRPPLEDARIVQGSFSFPSGHAALSATFYGTIAYLLIVHVVRREDLRILVGILAGLLVLAIGISRVYLGVHYPSDVLAGWAAGALWVGLLIVAEGLWQGRQAGVQPPSASSGSVSPLAPGMAPGPTARHPSPQRRALTVATALVVLVVAVTALSLTYRTIPPPPTLVPPTPQVIVSADVPSRVSTQLPHYTETLFGHPQEPISLIFVGTRAQLERVFAVASWTEAHPLTLGTLWQAIGASVTQRPDPAGPVTPSFVADHPNALAFSQPVGNTFAQRHHIRLWSTDVATSDGRSLWLATASYDRGFELAKSTLLPTHQIAPDIDNERAYVVTSLQGTGLVAQAQTLQLVPPESGQNFAGDPFHTDGKAVILYLS